MAIKMIKLHRVYISLCKKIDKELIEKNEYKCFFCGKDLANIDKRFKGHHHCAGRDSDMLLAKKYLKPAENSCHLSYHQESIEQLQKKPWYNDFLERLRALDEELYQKELIKSLKA